MEELLKKYKEANAKLTEIYSEIEQYSDGYQYISEVWYNRNCTRTLHNNEYIVQTAINQHGYGNNVNIITTNNNHKLLSSRDIEIVSLSEFEDLIIKHNLK